MMKMKIAHIITTFLPRTGGAEITAHNVLNEQHKSGADVTALVPWRSWRYMRPLVPYRILPLLPLTAWMFINGAQTRPRLRLLLAKQLQLYQSMHQFNIWHAHMAYIPGILLGAVLPHIGVPAVLTCQGEDIQKLPEIGYGVRLNPQLDKLVVEALFAFDKVTAVSDSVRGEFLSAGLPSQRIKSIPNGVDVERIRHYKSDRLKTRTLLNWPRDKYILLTVGRNHPVKGYNLIPQMIQKLLQKRSDFLWVIIGRNTDAIREQAGELGVDSHIRVLDQIGPNDSNDGSAQFALPPAKLIQAYKSADLFVFPSMMETFGIVLAEAMAAELPVVTTDARGCRDIIKNEVNGLQSPVGDADAMVRNILRLLEDVHLRKRMTNQGIQSVEEYDWPRVAANFLDLYKELVQ